MKPNKPKILSSQPQKPGSSHPRQKPPLPSSNSFELSPIISELPQRSQSKSSFRLLEFPSPESKPETHRKNSKTCTEDLINHTTETSKSEAFISLMTPVKSWCSKCKIEVFSTVQVNSASFPIWRRICCNSCEINEKVQEVLHFCPKCGKVLEKFHLII